MDKDRKIQRYRQKDYSQVVTFPVEIIGRDGVVRQYSFEESIRLYQRRIASADLRYRDQEVVQAEKQHCLHRIDQLRRSFFAHYGWSAIQLVDDDATGAYALSAEVAAFLRRCLAGVHSQIEQFSFTHIEDTGDYRVYFVQPPTEPVVSHLETDGHFLLYVFTFQTEGPCAHRESFFDIIKLLQSLKLTNQGSTESLVAFFHTHDCGLILTGHGTLSAALHAEPEFAELGLSWPQPEDPDPVNVAMRLLSQGRFEEAKDLFVQGYKEHHFRRVAYLGAAVVADQLGDDQEAEIATVMGCTYFPGDPALIYHRAVNLLRQGQFGEAREQLRQVDSWPVGRGAAELLHGLACFAGGEVRMGRKHLRQASLDDFKLDPHLERALQWTQSQRWARSILVFSAMSLAVVCAASAVVEHRFIYLAGSIALVLLSRAIHKTWRRQLMSRLRGAHKQRLRLSSTSLLMSDIQQNAPQ